MSSACAKMCPFMAFHLAFVCSGFQIESGIERVELEEIAVGLAGRRARSAISDFAEVVKALPRPI
jgi:hypothetical protein